jgi:hypothetical protein
MPYVLHTHTQLCYDSQGLLRCGRVAGIDDEWQEKSGPAGPAQEGEAMQWSQPDFSLVALQPCPASQIDVGQTRINLRQYRQEWDAARADRKLRRDLAAWVHAATGDLTPDQEADQVRLAYQAVMVGLDD